MLLSNYWESSFFFQTYHLPERGWGSWLGGDWAEHWGHCEEPASLCCSSSRHGALRLYRRTWQDNVSLTDRANYLLWQTKTYDKSIQKWISALSMRQKKLPETEKAPCTKIQSNNPVKVHKRPLAMTLTVLKTILHAEQHTCFYSGSWGTKVTCSLQPEQEVV